MHLTPTETAALCQRYNRLAWKFAFRAWTLGYGKRLGTLEDCHQEAVLALLRAAAYFDPSRGTTFITYAYRVIPNQLQSKASEAGPIAFPGMDGNASARRLRARERAASCLDLRAAKNADGDIQIEDRPNRDDVDLRLSVDAAIARLPERWREIVRLRMLGVEFKEIGRRLGVTDQAIIQTAKRAYRRLKWALRSVA